ncbi:MAG: TetR family transcriptional regulator [Rhizobiales bacterium PAR1]|nr:MAG: TetR family transcriptional regulator [Rhizobiales bacterium PAR1]
MTRTGTAREKILAAAIKLVRAKGFTATTVDDLCVEAGVTKGAFFHHFASKEALGAAAAEHWSKMTAAFFAEAPYHQVADPLGRLFAYIQFRRDILRGELAEFTCLAGTMVQEVYAAHPVIGAACNASISDHAATLAPDIAAAMCERGLDPDGSTTGWSAESLALHTQAVLQGAFILAKAKGGPTIAEESVEHLSRYIRLLFTVAEPSRSAP